MRKTGLVSGLLVALALLPMSATAQRSGELLLFSEVNFQGRMFVLNSARESMPLGWQVRSVRVVPGEAWELCTRSRFRSPCNRVAQDMSNVRWIVSSARPSLVQTLPEVSPPTGNEQQSLRGMAAEFFPRPADWNGRVESCRSGAAACAQESANRFCRQRGWVGAAHSRQETVGGINFLADVLCTSTG